VIERYLNLFAQDAMKISLAVQVMSSTVAAAIDTHVTAGHMDNRYLTTALFAQEVVDLFDSFIGVAHYPEHVRLLHCLLTSTIKHMEYWRSAVDMI
jgi:hypothetical protein